MSVFTETANRFIVRTANRERSSGLRLAFDIEANGLLDKATKIHCIVAIDLDSDTINEYGPNEVNKALQYLTSAGYLTGHNICGYDLPLLKKLYDWEPSCKRIADTLIAGRLILPNVSEIDGKIAKIYNKKLGKLHGRYSLEAWGARLDIPKIGTGIEDWKEWTKETQERCVGDVKITKELWNFLQPDDYSQVALDLEYQVSAVCDRITSDGIPFDVDAAKKLSEEWITRHDDLEKQLAKEFPGKNLNSRKQLGRLLEGLGWTPAQRTKKTSQAKIDDEVLESIDKVYPQLKGLAEYSVIGRRLGQLINGKEAWISHVDDRGYIHGSVVHIGTPHSRAAHFNPNLAQVPNNKRGKPLAAECRALFHHHDDWVFVSCDQAGLQDRCFSHYLASFDGGAYGRSFVAGNDTHWISTIALDLVLPGTERDKNNKLHGALREGSKSFRYGFLFGMQAKRAAEIINNTIRAARAADPEL